MRMFRAICSVAACASILSCSDSTVTPTRHPTTPGTWTQEYPLSNRRVYGLWAGGGVAYAVGRDGLILRYDGSGWRVVESPVTTTLFAVWGSGPGDVYAVGDNGVTLHYHGSDWMPVTTHLDDSRLTAVAGRSASDVYVVGLNGNAAHFNGTAWAPAGPGTPHTYLAAWANDDGSVFFGADSVLMWDGFQWTGSSLATGAFVVSLWGTSVTNVYAANDAGSASDKGIYHYDGATWQRVYDTGASGPRVIVGTGADDIFVLGRFVDNGAVHWNGSSWAEIVAPVDGVAACIEGGDFLVADANGAIARYDGARAAFEPGLAVVDLYDVQSWSQGAIAVGARGTILQRGASAWTGMESGTASALRAVWGATPDDVFAVGDDGVVIHYDGAAWSPMSAGAASTLRDVWGTASDNVYAVGDDGVVLHYDGGGWNGVATLGVILTSVWGSGPEDLYAGASTGELFHDDGTGWGSASNGPDSEQLMDLWGTSSNAVFATEPRVSLYNGVGVGPVGRILRFNGTGWSIMADSLLTRPLHLWGESATDIYAAGTEYDFPGTLPFIITGRLLHYDGVAWAETGVEVPRRLSSVSGTPGRDVFVVGDAGTIIRLPR